MNLTLTCPTCGAELEVEDVAPGTVIECPACNHALTVPEPPPARVVVRRTVHAPSAPAAPAPAYTTTQRTSKKWKVLHLVGCVLMFAGVGYGYARTDTMTAMVAAVPGFLLILVARFGKWWTND